MRVVFTKDFHKALRQLPRNRATRARAAMAEAHMEGGIRSLTRTHHGESRLKCEKYDLGDGCRLVAQRVGGAQEVLAFLFVGVHDDCDRWLDTHKNYVWVVRPSDNTLEFTQVTPAVASPSASAAPPDSEAALPEPLLDLPLLRGLRADELARIGAPPPALEYLAGITGSAWEADNGGIIEHIGMLAGDKLAFHAIDLLTAAHRGEWDGVRQIIALIQGEAHVAAPAEAATALVSPENAERYYTWDDADGLPQDADWEDWMLFLHKEQKELVTKDLAGAARLRGVSGSGKTCVLVHRARHLARKYPGQQILVLTLTESMRKLLDSLLRRLCGVELAHINTMTMASFARETLGRHHPRGLRWYMELRTEEDRKAAMDSAVATVLRHAEFKGSGLPREEDALRYFLRDEFDYLRGRLTTGEFAAYLDPQLFARTGRGSPLSRAGRAVVLDGVREWDAKVRGRASPLLDHNGVVHAALDVLNEAGPHDGKYRCVLVDEVQDLAELDLRLLSRLRTPSGELLSTSADGLFLVGDGAQSIYQRGFSFRRLQLNVSGRSYVLKKNYRNTAEIMDAAYHLIRDYEYADVDEDHIQRPVQPDLASRHGYRPAVVRCFTDDDEAAFVATYIKDLLAQRGDLRPGLVCVIGVTPDDRRRLDEALRREGVSVAPLREDAGEPGESVRLSTIETAKGHEFVAVFIVGLTDGAMPRWASQTPIEVGQDAARLYVAMTRARDLLLMTYAQGRTERPSRFLASIAGACDEMEWRGGQLRELGARQ